MYLANNETKMESMNVNTMKSDLATMLLMAKQVQQQRLIEENHRLTESYQALCKEKGMVWSEMNTENHKEMIAEYKRRHPVTPAVDIKCDDEQETCFCGEHTDKEPAKEVTVKEVTVKEVTSKEDAKPWLDITKNIMTGTAEQVFRHIRYMTEDYSLLDLQVRVHLANRIGCRAETTFGYLPAPWDTNITDVDDVKRIIGKDGYYLKLTTTNTGVDFIWHDRVENHFCFWGTKAAVLEAMKIIQARIYKYGGCRFNRL